MSSYTRVLELIREAEIRDLATAFPRNARVLELGGGSGFQARWLGREGHEVTSIDLEPRAVRGAPYFPVESYDGHKLPFATASFDVVFSSNVLEHISNLNEILAEIIRVTKPDGISIHVLPTPAWRAWTILAHYPWALREISRRLCSASSRPNSNSVPIPASRPFVRFAFALRLSGLYPHGEYPNALAELYYFSRCRWERLFRAHGFDLVCQMPGGLFYTGQLLVPRLTVSARRSVAKFLGSACRVFILKPAAPRRALPLTPPERAS